MKLFSAIIAAACTALEAVASDEADGATCSSLNGPYCTGFGSEFASAPFHARQNLDINEEEMKTAEVAKTLKIEKILKQYEKQVTASDADDAFEESNGIQSIEKMLNGGIEMLSVLDDTDTDETDEGFTISKHSAYKLLEWMNGDELKRILEKLLEKVLLSTDNALHETSPAAIESLRATTQQLKELEDVMAYNFQLLDKSQLALIRHKFAKDRSTELRQTFEQIVIADDAHDRQVAFETAIFLLQLAKTESNTLNEEL